MPGEPKSSILDDQRARDSPRRCGVAQSVDSRSPVRCMRCGYSLEGGDTVRCPECGLEAALSRSGSLPDYAERAWLRCTFWGCVGTSAVTMVYCNSLLLSFWVASVRVAMPMVLVLCVVAYWVSVWVGTPARLPFFPMHPTARRRVWARGVTLLVCLVAGVAFSVNLPVPSFGAPTGGFLVRLVIPLSPLFFARYVARLAWETPSEQRLGSLIHLSAWGLVVSQVVAVFVWALTFIMGLTLTPADVQMPPRATPAQYAMVFLFYLPAFSIPAQAFFGAALALGMVRFAQRLHPWADRPQDAA